jgi:hypothetical protein
MQSRKNNRANTRSNNRSRKNRRSVKNTRKPTFAAKLAAFILEAVSPKDKIIWSREKGFTAKHQQVFGVLPFLHLNIKEHQFRDLLRNSHKNQVNTLADLCNAKHLDEVLHKVSFNCKNQSDKGILSFEEAIIDSINNRWGIRQNGRRHLAVLEKFMRKQVHLDIIKPASVLWAN